MEEEEEGECGEIGREQILELLVGCGHEPTHQQKELFLEKSSKGQQLCHPILHDLMAK